MSPVFEIVQCPGSLIPMPYLGAISCNFSISSFVGGNAFVVPSANSTPTSKNICSSPAGATEINIFSGHSLSFLNECGVPTGMLANVPAFATIFSPLTVNVISRETLLSDVDVRGPGGNQLRSTSEPRIPILD